MVRSRKLTASGLEWKSENFHSSWSGSKLLNCSQKLSSSGSDACQRKNTSSTKPEKSVTRPSNLCKISLVASCRSKLAAAVAIFSPIDREDFLCRITFPTTKVQTVEDENDLEEEVFEIEIDDVTYYCDDEDNGKIYKNEDGDMGDQVGEIKDGEATFF